MLWARGRAPPSSTAAEIDLAVGEVAGLEIGAREGAHGAVGEGDVGAVAVTKLEVRGCDRRGGGERGFHLTLRDAVVGGQPARASTLTGIREPKRAAWMRDGGGRSRQILTQQRVEEGGRKPEP